MKLRLSFTYGVISPVQSIQLKLKAVSKNRMIYEAIAHSLMNMSYEKTRGGQCKTKMRNLTPKYRKVKDGNRKSGNSLDSSVCLFRGDGCCPRHKVCIGTASSFAHVDMIRIRSGLATNKV